MSHPDFDSLRADFGEVIDILNEGPIDQPVEKPGQEIWEAIAAGLSPSESSAAADQAGFAASTVDEVSNTPDVAGSPIDEGVLGQSGSSAEDDSDVESPFRTPRGSFSHRGISIGKRFAIMTAVAAAILLVAVPLTLALNGDSIDQRAELLALGGSGADGVAELNDGGSLEVRLNGLEPLEGAVYELWLLDVDDDGQVGDLLSLGNVADDGTFAVPEDLDLSEFSVVDVSIEPEDGDETHSGNSVLRGELEDL